MNIKYVHIYSARNKTQKLVGCFLKVADCCPIEYVQEMWPTIMDFGWPNVEIGWKMTNGQLLFLAHIYYMLITYHSRSVLSHLRFLG